MKISGRQRYWRNTPDVQVKGSICHKCIIEYDITLLMCVCVCVPDFLSLSFTLFFVHLLNALVFVHQLDALLMQETYLRIFEYLLLMSMHAPCLSFTASPWSTRCVCQTNTNLLLATVISTTVRKLEKDNWVFGICFLTWHTKLSTSVYDKRDEIPMHG